MSYFEEKIQDMLAEAVMRGIAWLDTKVPGWESNISLLELDLESSTKDILGQLHYRPNMMSEPSYEELGLWAADPQICARLTRQWRRILRERRAVV